jgi:hypothetical protein
MPSKNVKINIYKTIGLNGKFLRFSNEKSIIFLNIFTKFNQLYNFHCLLLPSPNVSQAFQFRPCKNFLVAYAYTISSKTQKLSVQPSIILPVIFYECKTWSLTLIEEHIEGV